MVADCNEHVSRLHRAVIGAFMLFSLAIAPGFVGSAVAVPLASFAHGASGIAPRSGNSEASDPGDEARAEFLLDIHDRYVAILEGYLELRNLIAPAVAQAGLSGPRLVDVAATMVREHVAKERERARQESQEELEAATVEVSSAEEDVTIEDVEESNEFLRSFIEDATGYLEAVLSASDGRRPVAEGVRAVGSFLDVMQSYDEALQGEG
jgi:hypothetical protein